MVDEMHCIDQAGRVGLLDAMCKHAEHSVMCQECGHEAGPNEETCAECGAALPDEDAAEKTSGIVPKKVPKVAPKAVPKTVLGLVAAEPAAAAVLAGTAYVANRARGVMSPQQEVIRR